MFGSLLAACTAAFALWLSRSIIGVTADGAVPMRVGFVRPWWELAALIGIAALLVCLLRPGPTRLLPLYASALLLIPWVPGPLPAAFLVWTDGVVPLVWMAIAVGAMAALPRAAVAGTARRWCTDPRHAPIAALLIALGLYLGASKQIAPRIPAGDEPHYLVITQTLLHQGDLRIEATHRTGAFRD